MLVKKLKRCLNRWVEVGYLFGRSQEVAEDYIVLGPAPGCIFGCIEDP